jgi:hypothetical protein
MEIIDFFNSCIKNNSKTLTIIDKLIKDFKYNIKSDNMENDIRTVILHNYYYGTIKIIVKLLYKEDYFEIIEYTELYHKYFNEVKKYEIYTK